MIAKILAIYRTDKLTPGIIEDIERVKLHADYSGYVLNGGLLMSVAGYYELRGEI